MSTNSTALKFFNVLMLATLMAGPFLAQAAVLEVPNPDANTNDSYGRAVAFDGTTVVVGALGDQVGGVFVGTTYVFSAAGAPIHTIPSPNPLVETDRFGGAVSVSGNNIVVGSSGYGIGSDDNVGIAYLFETTSGTLTHVLNNPNGDHFDFFGHSVSVSGNHIAVGSPLDDAGSVANAGTVYLFDAVSGNLTHTIPNPSPSVDSRFGESVAVFGNNVVIGAPKDQTSQPGIGMAYLFDAVSGNLIHTFSGADRGFGSLVAISDSYVAVTDPYESTTAKSGTVSLFDATTGGLLHEMEDPGANVFFGDNGAALAISGNVVLVGSTFGDEGGANTGSAYLFDTVKGRLIATLVSPQPEAFSSFGMSVDIQEDVAIVGAPNLNFSTGTAFLFSGLPVTPWWVALIVEIEELLGEGTLTPGQTNALTKKIDNALAKLDKGNTKAACNQLGAFENQVNSLIDDGIITAVEGQVLLDLVAAAKIDIGC